MTSPLPYFAKKILSLSVGVLSLSVAQVYASNEEHTEPDHAEAPQVNHVEASPNPQKVSSIEDYGFRAAEGSSPTATRSTELIEKFAPNWESYRTTGVFGDLPVPGEKEAHSDFDTTAAETRYIEQLSQDISDDKRKSLLLEMAAMFERHNIKPKVAAVYEKYIEMYADDPLVPEIYMRLGFIYREMGAFDQALSKFYSVLNTSLSVNPEKAEMYRVISLKAQLEIADTHYAMGDYQAAAKFFDRLKRLNLPDEDRALVDFKFAYSQYLLENYPVVISNLQAFIKNYPDNKLVPESHFILANAYKHLGQPREAVNETLSLLRFESNKDHRNNEVWMYWKKRTGNQLANEFYEQGDFVNSLRIYQAMAKLSNTPDWQWPVVYQIGLCFERLRMFPRAIAAYEHILTDPEMPDGMNFEPSESLKSIRELAQWRLEHLNWLTQTEARLSVLLDPAIPGLDDEPTEE
ncbi:MAG: tetratricopeptide repeat protein [Opitutales bacterium]|nr:tetratricopeptide repeat protein [Opitutales bacterium]